MSEKAPILEALPAPKHEALLTAEAARHEEEQAPEKLDIAKIHEQLDAATKNEQETFDPYKKLEADQEATKQQPVSPKAINSELKNITLNRELQQIRRKLPRPEQALSKVIHQPAVRAISEATGRTVTRPSGLLGGGIVAFIGTSAYVYFAKHIGVKYNYLLFIMFFVGGFVIGLLLEFILWVSVNRQRKLS